jgi:chemotaxis receptor (MCP) glutamine deamidase CheD
MPKVEPGLCVVVNETGAEQSSLVVGAVQLKLCVQLFGAAEMVAFEGQLLNTGEEISLTVTLKLQLAVLPLIS